jgi:diguanylate cyclase (GGDEF)-like protein
VVEPSGRGGSGGRRTPDPTCRGRLVIAGAAVALIATLVPHGDVGWRTAAFLVLVGVGGEAVVRASHRRGTPSATTVAGVAELAGGVVVVTTLAAGHAPHTAVPVWALGAVVVLLAAARFGPRGARLAASGLAATQIPLLVVVAATVGRPGVAAELVLLVAVLGGVAATATLQAPGAAHRQRTAGTEPGLFTLAYHDVLTGLPNRASLQVVLDELDRAPAGGAYAVGLIDLDGFKALNDRYGHAAGDALLAQVGPALAAAVRAGDVVARLAGDEFVVVSHGVADATMARALGVRLLGACRAELAVPGGHVRTDGSLGFALGRTGEEAAREVLRRADAAMYDAKRSGRRVRIEVAPRPRGGVHARSGADVRCASVAPASAAASAASRSSR